MKWDIYFPLSEVKEGSAEFESLKQAAESGMPSAQHDMGYGKKRLRIIAKLLWIGTKEPLVVNTKIPKMHITTLQGN